MSEFKMPKLGADMDEGILLEWKVAPGDAVKKGDIVAVVETSKGAIDVEVFDDGVIESLLVEPDSVVPVGAVIADIRTSSVSLRDSLEADTASVDPVSTSHEHAKPPDSLVATETQIQPASVIVERPNFPPTRQRLSPRARRLAEQLQVDLTNVQGTGPGGSIVAEDVQAAADKASVLSTTAAEKKPTSGAAKSIAKIKHQAMREAIAATMSRSKREIPHYYLAQDVDVSALLTFVQSWNDGNVVDDRILPALLYYKAIGQAATEFDSMNGFYSAATDSHGAFQTATNVNLGIAISLRGGGLMAPCLIDVPNKSAVELMRELKDLVLRTRKGGLRASEISEGTLTVSNLGDRGVDFLAGVIYPPQVALVGIGSMSKRPWAFDDKIEVRPIINLSLAADHRVSDGHTGALFLRRIEQLMNEPEKLM